MPVAIHPNDCRGRSPTWLLDLVWAGRTWRLTDGPDVDVVLDTGTYRYLGGLKQLTVEERLDLWASEGAVVSVPMELLPPDGFDVASLAEVGHVLSAATGVLRVCYDPTTAAATREVLAGRVVQPVYGVAGDTVSFSLEAEVLPTTAEVPDSKAVVDADTWAGNGDGNVQGLRYPIPIGYPGAHVTEPGAAIDYTRGSPALYVSGIHGGFSRIMVSGLRVRSANIRLYNNADSTKDEVVAVFHVADGRGRTIAAVTSSDAAHLPAEGDELWVGWPTTDLGGIPNPYGPGVLEGAGDVIRWALDESGREWDRDRAGELALLNGIKIGTYIGGIDSAGVDPWEWCKSEILPLVPASVVVNAWGLRVVPWRYRATARGAILALEEGRNCELASSVRYGADDECASRITVAYGPRADTGSLGHTLTACAADDPTDETIRAHPLCVRSLATYRSSRGLRAPERVIEVVASVVNERASAGLVLDYLVHRHALPRRTIEVSVRPDVAETVDLGSVVTFTSASLAWSAVLCHVSARSYSGPDCLLTLDRWEAP